MADRQMPDAGVGLDRALEQHHAAAVLHHHRRGEVWRWVVCPAVVWADQPRTIADDAPLQRRGAQRAEAKPQPRWVFIDGGQAFHSKIYCNTIMFDKP